jgi:mRNA (guanine-N7-)-methyltransferase
MDIRKAEFDQLKRLTQEWLDHPEQELEATFTASNTGATGQVNSTIFASIAKRLKNRGYTSVTQEDKLNIITPKHVRITLSGLGVIQQYCRDDRLSGRTFSAIIKDRTVQNATLDLEEYGVRIKARRERELDDKDPEVAELLDQWKVQQKAFRLLRRWTFRGQGIRFDLSMIRQTKKNVRGEYRWQTKFTQQDISKEAPIYEVEVELERVEGDTADLAIQRLVKGVGEILRGIQKCPLLIKESVKRQVYAGYKGLTKTDRFRGVSTRTLELANMVSQVEPGSPNIREGYNVTDKADGLRTMGYVTETGHLYLIDSGPNVYETGLEVEGCANSLVDGEWITKNTASEAIHQYLIFDIYFAPGGRDVHGLPFHVPDAPTAPQRYNEMKAWEKLWNAAPGQKELVPLTPKTKLLVSCKKFLFAKAGEIFAQAAKILDTPRIYETDGLIFTKNSAPIPEQPQGDFKEQMKWKPPHDNTIDFLVVTEKIPETTQDSIHNGFHPTSGKQIRYKVLRLHVGFRGNPSRIKIDPREIVLQVQSLKPDVGPGANVYRPVLFQPEDFPDDKANVCYVEVKTDPETGDEYAYCENSNEPIVDKSIVEISYDASRPAGWRWVPKLVRKDKTERLMKGELGRTLNSNDTAQSIWNSIHEPVTLSMVRTGAEQPNLTEVTAVSAVEKERAAITQKYADRTASEKDMNRIGPLRDFHNKYIKETILYNAIMRKPGLGLIDLGMGLAQDIQKWRRVNAGAVLGIDIAGDSINNPNHGAYQRLYSTMLRNGRDKVLPMVFAVGDASKNMRSGEAGTTVDDKVILQAVLGRTAPEGVVPAYVRDEMSSRFKMGADVISCMFATHYFFETAEKFGGFLQNIADNLKLGGFFIGCCFDGERTFDFLRGRDSRVGEEDGSTLWKISKKYEADEIPAGDEAFGMPVDVEFISIGLPHREYLVPFKLLQDKMATIGCELCNDEELKALGLTKSTEFFEESHKVAAKAGRKFPMTPAVAQFSFLNRWFVFRRKNEVGQAPEAKSVAKKANALPSSSSPTSGATVPSPTSGTTKPATSVLPVPLISLEEEEGKEDEGKEEEGKEELANTRKQYDTSTVLQFELESAPIDKLRIGDKLAQRWLAPGSPFPIQDPDPRSAGESYPTMEHFLAAMKYKVATDKPAIAQSLFGSQGTIHQKFLRQKQAEIGVGAGSKPLTEAREAALLVEEMKEVHQESRLAAMKKWKAKFEESRWTEVKDDLLENAVKQRWDKDARFRKIVDAAREQGKYLLFFTGSSSSEYGGKRTKEGYLEGENKLGKAIMKVAGFE